MSAVEKLDLEDFKRRLVTGSFPEFSDLSAALLGMRFVQADPIRSPARAQDLVLRQRVLGYKAADLEKSFPRLSVEEGYLFAYGFTTPEIWRDLRWRPREKLEKLEREILKAVDEMGEVHPRDLDERFGKQSVENYWGGKSQVTKRVLEDLHHHGFLRVSRRDKGVRVYQVPSAPDVEENSSFQRYCNLALATAYVFGPTSRRFLMAELRAQGHLLSQRKQREQAIGSLLESGKLQEVEVEGVRYIWIRKAWQEDAVPDRVRILAPFDPLVRNRARFEQAWGWTYRFEAYVPAAKRQRGYYAMPLLWNAAVIGWANAKVVDGHLDVEFGYIGKRPRSKAFRFLAEAEVEAMALFLGLESGSWKIGW